MNNWFKLKKAGITDTIIYKLMLEMENYEDIFKLNEKSLNKIIGDDSIAAEKIMKSDLMDLNEEKEKLEKNKIKIISYKDSTYPESLRNIISPPLFLYVKGKLGFSEKAIGIVGTRKMTSYGSSACEKITKELVDKGVTIVSGLADGIDAVAHSKAIANAGDTIAVVGTGLDLVYPEINRKLWREMEERGTIISEYPLGTEPFRWNFPQRNRIIVGLSRGVIVIESYADGGSLITAKIALDEGRDVFAVPGFISYPSFEGCNNLIKKSEAKLITCAADVTDEYGWEGKHIPKAKIDELMTNKEKLIYGKLIVEKNLDEIIYDTKIKSTDVLVILMEMEIKGIVKSVPGGRYKRA